MDPGNVPSERFGFGKLRRAAVLRHGSPRGPAGAPEPRGQRATVTPPSPPWAGRDPPADGDPVTGSLTRAPGEHVDAEPGHAAHNRGLQDFNRILGAGGRPANRASQRVAGARLRPDVSAPRGHEGGSGPWR